MSFGLDSRAWAPSSGESKLQGGCRWLRFGGCLCTRVGVLTSLRLDGRRALYAANCRVRAWLQFGRVPHVAHGSIADLRFEHPIGQNFTPMAVEAGGSRCPSFVTGWELPRHDVLTDSSDSR